jgi:hypothetical protein
MTQDIRKGQVITPSIPIKDVSTLLRSRTYQHSLIEGLLRPQPEMLKKYTADYKPITPYLPRKEWSKK